MGMLNHKILLPSKFMKTLNKIAIMFKMVKVLRY